MGIDIKIHIDLSHKQKKIVRAAVVVGAVIGALGVGIAVAAPVQWGASETLTSRPRSSSPEASSRRVGF